MSVQPAHFRTVVPSILERNRLAHRMLDLREAGVSYGNIARVIALDEDVRLSENQVRWECLSRGARMNRRMARA